MSDKPFHFVHLEVKVGNFDCVVKCGYQRGSVLTYINVTDTKLQSKNIDQLNKLMPNCPHHFTYASWGIPGNGSIHNNISEREAAFRDKTYEYWIGFDNFVYWRGKYGYKPMTQDEAVQSLHDTVAEIYRALVFLDIGGQDVET